jgi:pimeloyl-ACP methyl ester carboxylesterase
MAIPRESREVEVEGCAIRYLRWGDPSKPGIVLVHGFLAHARCFAFIAPLLARDFHVVAYDVSGYGDSGYRPDYSSTVRARELLAVAEHAGMAESGVPVECPYLLEYIARHSLEPHPGGWTWKFHPSSFAVDARSDDWWIDQPRRFVALDARKAVVYGERSALFDTDTEDHLRELGADRVPMVAIPDARHHLMLDQPLAFTSALRAILATW